MAPAPVLHLGRAQRRVPAHDHQGPGRRLASHDDDAGRARPSSSRVPTAPSRRRSSSGAAWSCLPVASASRRCAPSSRLCRRADTTSPSSTAKATPTRDASSARSSWPWLLATAPSVRFLEGHRGTPQMPVDPLAPEWLSRTVPDIARGRRPHLRLALLHRVRPAQPPSPGRPVPTRSTPNALGTEMNTEPREPSRLPVRGTLGLARHRRCPGPAAVLPRRADPPAGSSAPTTTRPRPPTSSSERGHRDAAAPMS